MHNAVTVSRSWLSRKAPRPSSSQFPRASSSTTSPSDGHEESAFLFYADAREALLKALGD